jgi:GNAT superfamily N-acetyltransferase
MKPLPEGVFLSGPHLREPAGPFENESERDLCVYAVHETHRPAHIGSLSFVLTPKSVHVSFIQVLPSLRRLGIGEQMLKLMLDATFPRRLELGSLTEEGELFFARIFSRDPATYRGKRFSKALRAAGVLPGADGDKGDKGKES